VARLLAVSAMWQDRGNSCPLLVRKFIAAHGSTPLRSRSVGEMELPIHCSRGAAATQTYCTLDECQTEPSNESR
jgi:hypothetical protein